MPAITRLCDNASQHEGFPQHPSVQASNNVFINNLGIVVIGDAYAVHSDGHTSHSGNLIQGSPNVFVNNLAVGRIGDAISCGGVVIEGSPNVFAN